MNNLFTRMLVLGLLGPGYHLLAQANPVSLPAQAIVGQDLRDLKAKAENGDAAAQYQMSRYFATDHEGERANIDEKIKWIVFAAKNGHGLAQMEFAKFCHPPTDSVIWFRKAADQGFAYAQFQLGLMYANGRIVSQNRAEAMKWFLKAAMQGIPGAQENVAIAYMEGDSGVKNYIEAYAWFTVASIRGASNSLSYREKVFVKLSPADLLKAKARGGELQKQASLLDLDRLPPDEVAKTDALPETAKKRSSHLLTASSNSGSISNVVRQKSNTNSPAVTENKFDDEIDVVRKMFSNWINDYQDPSKDISKYYTNIVYYYSVPDVKKDDIKEGRQTFWSKFAKYKIDVVDPKFIKKSGLWQCSYTKKIFIATKAPTQTESAIAKSEVWFQNVSGEWLIALERDLN